MSILQGDPTTFERYILLACLHSRNTYLKIRDSLCPVNPETGMPRQDFKVAKFNRFYEVIDELWRLYDGQRYDTDLFLDYGTVYARVVDRTNAGQMDQGIAYELCNDMASDFFNPAYATDDPFRLALTGRPFNTWLDNRLAEQLSAKIAAGRQQGHQDLDSLREMMKRTESARRNEAGESGLSGFAAAQGSIVTGPPVSKKIMQPMQKLMAGIRRYESTMIAAANGGGKTIFGVQLLKEAIMYGCRVVYVTTEDPPHMLVRRLASSFAEYLYGDLLQACVKEQTVDANGDTIEPKLPASLFQDPTFGPILSRLMDLLYYYCYFIDWSTIVEGREPPVVERDLMPEMERIFDTGWNPDLMILDWIGGALKPVSGPAEQTRQVYENAANTVVDVGKRFPLHAFCMAQANKDLVKNQKAVTMAMLSECKTMTNKMPNFVGISTLRRSDAFNKAKSVDFGLLEDTGSLMPVQYFNLDRVRNGPGGLLPVVQEFHYQRFNLDEGMELAANQGARPTGPGAGARQDVAAASGAQPFGGARVL